MKVLIEKHGSNPPQIQYGRVYAIDPVGFIADVQVDVLQTQIAISSDIAQREGTGEYCAVINISRIEPDPALTLGCMESKTSIAFVAENDYEQQHLWGLHSFLSLNPHIVLMMTDQNLDCRAKTFEQLKETTDAKH